MWICIDIVSDGLSTLNITFKLKKNIDEINNNKIWMCYHANTMGNDPNIFWPYYI